MTKRIDQTIHNHHSVHILFALLNFRFPLVAHVILRAQLSLHLLVKILQQTEINKHH